VDRSPHRPLRAGVSESETHLTAARLVQSQAPSLGFSQRPPLHRHSSWCPLPRAEARIGPAPPGALLVPPAPFPTASTASSTSRFAGLLHPASDREVHRVSTPRRRMPAVASALPHRCLPSRAFPFREAVHASPRGLAPLPFPGNAGATSRPCSARKSVTAAARGRTPLFDALLGFPAWSPTPHRSGWPSPRRQCHPCPKAGHTACAGEEERGGITAAPRQQGSGPSATPSKRCPRRSLPSKDDRPPSRTRGAPRVRRTSASTTRRKAGSTAATSKVSWISWPVVANAEAIAPVCSAAFREVGGRRRAGST